MNVGFGMRCLLMALTIVFCIANETLLSEFILQFGQEVASTTTICLVNASQTPQNIIRFLAEDKYTVTFAYLSSQSSKHISKCSVYLLFELLYDFTAACHQLDDVFLSNVWNPSGLFIFFCESEHLEEPTEIYSRIAERYGLRRSLLQTHSSFVFYDIFAKQLIISNSSYYDVLLKLSPANPLINAYGYELRAAKANTLYPYFTKLVNNPTGPFIQFLTVLSSTSNITIRWLYEETIFPNYSYMLESNQINAVFFKNIHSSYTIRLPSHERDTKCLFMQEKPIDNFFILLLTPFTSFTWVSIIAVAVTCIVLNYLYANYFPRNLLLMTFFGLTLPWHRLTRSERLVMLMLNQLLLILSSVYLSKMLGTMYSLRYEHHIQSIREFGQSGILVYSPEADERARIKAVYPSWGVIGPETGWKISDHSARTIRYVLAEYFIQSVHNLNSETGRQWLYYVREPLFWDALVHSFTKSNPLVERFAQVWNRMYEAGIVRWLIGRFVNEHYLRRKLLDDSFLQFGDLISMWWILAYGYCGSGIVLVGEIVWNGFRKSIYSKLYGKNVAKLSVE